MRSSQRNSNHTEAPPRGRLSSRLISVKVSVYMTNSRLQRLSNAFRGWVPLGRVRGPAASAPDACLPRSGGGAGGRGNKFLASRKLQVRLRGLKCQSGTESATARGLPILIVGPLGNLRLATIEHSTGPLAHFDRPVITDYSWFRGNHGCSVEKRNWCVLYRLTPGSHDPALTVRDQLRANTPK